MYICICIYTHVPYVCRKVLHEKSPSGCMRVCVNACTFVCVNVCMSVCLHVRLCACVNVCIHL